MLTAKDFSLGDDGTLDTVIVCKHCGAELRYNFDSDGYDPELEPQEAYDSFVDWAMDDSADQHECEVTP